MNKYDEQNDVKSTFGLPTTMSFDVFKECIDKIPKYVDIHFSGFSEPFLNPKCADMIQYAHEHGHKIAVFTTLVGLKEQDIFKIKDIPFIAFVIHLPDGEKYAKILPTQNYLDVLKKLISLKIYHMSCMTMGTLPSEIISIIKQDFSPNKMHNRAGNCDYGMKVNKKLGPLICSKANLNGENTLDQNVLLPNGDLSLCCMDYGLENIIGNLISQDYESILDGSKHKEIVKKLQSHDDEIICRNCYASRYSVNPYPVKEKLKTLKDEYGNFIIKIYDDLLYRYPAQVEYDHLYAMLSNKQMTFDDVYNFIFNCEERRGLRPLPFNHD